MKTNTEQLKIAESFLGQKGTTFQNYCGIGNNAWCCAFVSYIFNKAGNSSLFFGGKKVAYCPTAIKWCEANLAQIPIYLALPSDIIFFDWQPNGIPDHIGFVRERKSDQEIYTIEGNTSGGIVANKTRTVKYVQGVFRPHFKATFDTKNALVIDGYFGYNSIACLQKVLGVTVDGILGKSTVKALQKKVGVTQDGSWGVNTSKAVQKMVGTTVDGAFGAKSVKALQKWINKQMGAKAEIATVDDEPVKVTPKSYSGEYPNIIVKESKPKSELIAKTANELAYKTADTKAKYPSGKPVAAFKKAFDKVYPTHSKWGKVTGAGASCDVWVGVIVRASGVDSKFPRGLAEQKNYLPKCSTFSLVSTDPTKAQTGDIITYSHATKKGGHICIKYGTKLKHAAYNAWYGRTTAVGNRFKPTVNKDFKVWRAKGTYETTRNYLMMLDKGSEVLKLQKYLNWYNGKKVLAEDSIFGVETLKALKAFQTDMKITADGLAGTATLKAMKGVVK